MTRPSDSDAEQAAIRQVTSELIDCAEAATDGLHMHPDGTMHYPGRFRTGPEVVPLEELLASQQTGPGLPSIEYLPDGACSCPDPVMAARSGHISRCALSVSALGRRIAVTPDGHEPSLTCPCGPVLGPDGLMHTLEFAEQPLTGIIELDAKEGTVTIRGLHQLAGWAFVKVGPDAFDWRPADEPLPAGADLTGAQLVAAERLRQVMMEGYTEDHDREHGHAILARAAYCYETGEPAGWPWREEDWKPKDRLADYVRSAALYQAAGDVVDDDHPGLRTYYEDQRDRVIGYIDGILNTARHLLGGGA